MADVTKTCRVCKAIKPITEFYTNKSNKDLHCSECKPCSNEQTKRWQHANREKCNAFKKIQMHKPQNRIAHNGRTAIRKIIRNLKPEWKFLNESGAMTRGVLMGHLESTVPTGYTMADYGSTLCVDHIVPCAKFDLTDRKQYRKCFHYTNLRIVTVSENLRKGSK